MFACIFFCMGFFKISVPSAVFPPSSAPSAASSISTCLISFVFLLLSSLADSAVAARLIFDNDLRLRRHVVAFMVQVLLFRYLNLPCLLTRLVCGSEPCTLQLTVQSWFRLWAFPSSIVTNDSHKQHQMSPPLHVYMHVCM